MSSRYLWPSCSIFGRLALFAVRILYRVLCSSPQRLPDFPVALGVPLESAHEIRISGREGRFCARVFPQDLYKMRKCSPFPPESVAQVGEGSSSQPGRLDVLLQPVTPSFSSKTLPLEVWDWSSLPLEVMESILALLPFNDILRYELVCKDFRTVLKGGTFHQARAARRLTECSLSPLVFYAKEFDQSVSCYLMGFDWEAGRWRKLPPFKALIPAPDLDLLKDILLVAGDKGLVLVALGKASEDEKLYVCNPLTGNRRELPPLKFARHPTIMCLHTTLHSTKDSVESSYWVIAIGGEGSGAESPPRITEVYDSVRGTWEQASNMPEPGISLQSGVFCESENLLLCVGLKENGNIGILAFDVEGLKWRENGIFPFQPDSVRFHAAKLVELNGRIFLFSEQEAPRSSVTLCIDNLKLESEEVTREVARARKRHGSIMPFSNQYTCMPLGENKLCIYNTLVRDQPGVVYDVPASNPSSSGTSFRISRPQFLEKGIKFQTLESQACVFQPSFGVMAANDRFGIEDALLSSVLRRSVVGLPVAEIQCGALFAAGELFPLPENRKY